jgi:hypothetical protein
LDQKAQFLFRLSPVLIAADQIAEILAVVAIAPAFDLSLDPSPINPSA